MIVSSTILPELLFMPVLKKTVVSEVSLVSVSLVYVVSTSETILTLFYFLAVASSLNKYLERFTLIAF